MAARFAKASMLVSFLALSAGCGSKESVILSAGIKDPTLDVAGKELVTDVTGQFGMVLSLGDRASDPTEVALGVFSLQRGGNVLLSPLLLDANPGFPLTVGVGKTRHVDVTITNRDAPSTLATELCAGDLEIVGTLTDSLGDDRARTLSSGPFPPVCH